MAEVRVEYLRSSSDYVPDFQVDVYGTIGEAFGQDIEAIGKYCAELVEIVHPYNLRIEGRST